MFPRLLGVWGMHLRETLLKWCNVVRLEHNLLKFSLKNVKICLYKYINNRYCITALNI